VSYTEREIARLLHANPDLSIMGNGAISAPVANVVSASQMSEHDMQVEIIQECQRRALTNPDYQMIFAIPNGGHRHPAVAAKLKAEGVQAGLPDLMCILARHSRHGALCEIKVGNNKPSEAQNWWIRRLRVEGYICEVIYDDPAKIIAFFEWYIER
jgi:hypothetical protein